MQGRAGDVIKSGNIVILRDHIWEKCKLSLVDNPEGAVIEIYCPPKVWMDG